MRILLISHTCQSATEGQPRAHHLGTHPDVQLRVIVPSCWKHYGTWRAPETPRPDASFELQGEKVSFPWVGPAQCYLHFYPQLASLIREFEPDVIDVWEEPWAAVAAQACMIRKRVAPRARIVTETEQNIAKKLPLPFQRFQKYVLNRTDHAIARSDDAGKVLRVKGFRGPISIVPNGVDSDHFRPLDQKECKQALGVKGFVIGYVGRLVEEKGITDLLDAAEMLSQPVSILLIGSGQLEEQLRDRIASSKLNGQVTLLPNQPHLRLPEMMNAMDCLVLPSRTTRRWKEQFGRVIIEAAACGVPVIGSSSGAIPGVVGDGGIIFSEGNAVEMADALRTLQMDPAYARRLGMNGRSQVEQRYSWRRVAEMMVEVYERVLSTERSETGAETQTLETGPVVSKPAVASSLKL